ncbi:MAG TPA: nuclear transport factor 2 family protein [Pyrinomonadaceae bacterium]|jgi:hypothetical protein
MMSEEQNIQIAQGIFDAFGRGDVPGLLSFIAEDVSWTIPGPDNVPYYGERRGHHGVMDFLVKIGSSVELYRFEPREFIAKDERVIVLGGEGGRVKPTRKHFDIEWAIVFTINDGKLSRFYCYEDTAAVSAAFQPD